MLSMKCLFFALCLVLEAGAVLHGKQDEHFSLVSDVNFQINARYVRSRDYSQIEALGVLFSQNMFTLEATCAMNWDDAVQHLKFTYNEDEIIVPKGHLSRSESSDSEIIIERISDASILITLSDFAEISVIVVRNTNEEKVQGGHCFAYLEFQFKFYGLSPNVEGLLGRHYQLKLRNPAKPGVAMPVIGGEYKYRTDSLLSPECCSCIYSPAEKTVPEDFFSIMDHGRRDYSGGGDHEWNIA